VIKTPADGVANTASSLTINPATSVTTGSIGETFALNTSAGLPSSVTVAADAGAFVSTTASTPWDGGKSTLTVPVGTTVYVFGTKVGAHTLTVTPQNGTAQTFAFNVQNSASDGYNYAVTPASQNVLANGGFTLYSVKITDVFGNPVVGAQVGDDTSWTYVGGTGTAAGWTDWNNVGVSDATGTALLGYYAPPAGITGSSVIVVTPDASQPTTTAPKPVGFTATAVVAAAPVNTTTSVTAPLAAGSGQKITITTLVAGVDGSIPTGQVQLFVRTQAVGSPVSLNSLGSATFAYTTGAAGNYPIAVRYLGDATHTASTSALTAITVSVNQCQIKSGAFTVRGTWNSKTKRLVIGIRYPYNGRSLSVTWTGKTQSRRNVKTSNGAVQIVTGARTQTRYTIVVTDGSCGHRATAGVTTGK
jgi:hypothetical protein